MTFQEATNRLAPCIREECRDHAFGDREVFWSFNGETVATGYAGSTGFEVSFSDGTGNFVGKHARILMEKGKLGQTYRNDETGDDYYHGY